MNDSISRKWLIECVEEGWIKFETEKDKNKFVHLIRDTAPSVSNSENPNKWIPVSERLPEEENKRYWICTDCGYQCECRWTNVNHIWTYLTTDWHWHIMDVPQYSKVVAWMPLPKPYKTDKEVNG